MTPEDRVRVRVDALDAAVRTEPYVDAGELTEELVEQWDAALLVRAERFERWILDPVTSRGALATTTPAPPDPGVVTVNVHGGDDPHAGRRLLDTLEAAARRRAGGPGGGALHA